MEVLLRGLVLRWSPGHRGCARCLFACHGQMLYSSSEEVTESASLCASALREPDDAVLLDAKEWLKPSQIFAR